MLSVINHKDLKELMGRFTDLTSFPTSDPKSLAELTTMLYYESTSNVDNSQIFIFANNISAQAQHIYVVLHAYMSDSDDKLIDRINAWVEQHGGRRIQRNDRNAFQLPDSHMLESELRNAFKLYEQHPRQSYDEWLEMLAVTAPNATCDAIGAETKEQRAWVTYKILYS